MPETNCTCQNLRRLDGAATQAYITKYLERVGTDSGGGEVYYHCRVCGARWQRVEDEGARRPSLVRVDVAQQ